MLDKKVRKRLHVGGQAVIEGVMMRSPTRIATAVRNPEGEIVVRAEQFTSLTKRYRLLNLPVVRGAITLVETFVIAVKALSFSADQATAEDSKGRPEESGKSYSRFHMSLIVLSAVVLGFTIFFYLPLILTERFGFKSGFLFNLVDGFFRCAFIFLYIFFITKWKEMKRVFEYHGAEHKTIFAFEEEGDVSLETILKYPRVHPRCSTSFLLLVVIVSVVLFIILGKPESLADRMVRFSFVPVIGGISYEVLRLTAKPSLKHYLGFLSWPGLFLQRYTTREPSSDQIEVAIAALNASLSDNLLET